MATCTSEEFDMSYRYPDTPPPLPGAPTFIPSSWIRPSVLRPPRAEKKLLMVAAPLPKPVA